MRKYLVVGLLFFIALPGCKKDNPPSPAPGNIQISSITIASTPLALSGTPTSGLPNNSPIVITFSVPLDLATVPTSVSLKNGTQTVESDLTFSANKQVVTLTPKQALSGNTTFTLFIGTTLKGASKEEFPGLSLAFKTAPLAMTVANYKVGGQLITTGGRILNVPLDLSIEITFTAPLDPATVTSSTVSLAGASPSTLVLTLSNENKTLTVTRATPLVYLSKYIIHVTSGLHGANGELFSGFDLDFYSALGNHTSGLPAKTDDELLTLVQQQTFKYFWDFAQPASGMARERNSSGELVTTGGSGFGVMSIIVGIERGFITRADGIARFKKIVGFLETADRFHGAWPHWMNGNTGKVIPFSTNDNGGDLVETSFMIQGLLTVRQYLQASDTTGNNLINRITTLWEDVEWDWYRRDGQNVLYWHWSPDKDWIMNFALSGYFEEQITYILAAASPTHGIPKIVYSNGYGQNGGIVQNRTYYGYPLPLGTRAPLFWVQYSYLGMDPHFSDDYANYWTQNVNATLIDQHYCATNTNFAGYSSSCWGLTASDNPEGYGAQSPDDDNGTIAPTAALSSFPYTPVESMAALRFFYDKLGDRIWGPYGFYDAFNVTESWYADSYLAIDQGPIIVMIENQRTALLWNLFMTSPEIQTAKTTLGLH